MANENLDIDSKTAEELYEWYLDDKLIINRRYQRKLVWSLEEKTALISSMTQQYPIPLLLFVSIDNKREILDTLEAPSAVSVGLCLVHVAELLTYDGRDAAGVAGGFIARDDRPTDSNGNLVDAHLHPRRT